MSQVFRTLSILVVGGALTVSSAWAEPVSDSFEIDPSWQPDSLGTPPRPGDVGATLPEYGEDRHGALAQDMAALSGVLGGTVLPLTMTMVKWSEVFDERTSILENVHRNEAADLLLTYGRTSAFVSPLVSWAGFMAGKEKKSENPLQSAPLYVLPPPVRRTRRTPCRRGRWGGTAESVQCRNLRVTGGRRHVCERGGVRAPRLGTDATAPGRGFVRGEEREGGKRNTQNTHTNTHTEGGECSQEKRQGTTHTTTKDDGHACKDAYRDADKHGGRR